MGFLKLQLPEERPSRSLQEKGSQAGVLNHYAQVLEARHSGQGCRNPESKDGKLWDTTDALVSTDGKLRFGKSFESSTCTTC